LLYLYAEIVFLSDHENDLYNLKTTGVKRQLILIVPIRQIINTMLVVMLCIISPAHSIAQSSVFINEVLAGPAPNPADASLSNTANANSLYSTDPNMQPPYNREYIELYNAHPCDTADISCYMLGSNANSGLTGANWGVLTFPQGTKIPPLGFLIVGGNNAPVPFNDFNITQLRQTSFNVQTLTGDNIRWFLRDAFGWIALYDPQGQPVDAIYWNDFMGSAMSLYLESEYQNAIINSLACGGQKTLPAAVSIPNIQYVGHISPGTMTSFQREHDGSATWYATPVSLTPRGPNGNPIVPPTLAKTIVPDHCGSHDGTITLHITPGGTGPYTVYWNGNPVPGGLTLANLAAGTYTVEVKDAYDCLNVYDTIVVPDDPGPEIQVISVIDEKCSAANGSVMTNISGGLPPYAIAWNTTPAINTATLLNIPAGVYHIIVTDAAGCLASDTITVLNHKEPLLSVILLSPDSCGQERGIALAQVTGDYHPYQYAWNSIPVQTDSLAVGLAAGMYTATVTDGVCTASAQINVPLVPGPVAAFSMNPSVVYVEDGVVSFTDLSQGPIVNWYWDFMDGNSATAQHPIHRFTSIGTYLVTLTVTDNIGCDGKVTLPVLVKDITAAFFPNAFTPDGDGLNDLFMPKGIYITQYTLQIFDRFGNLIFIANDPNDGWDGTLDNAPVPEGVYVWLAKFLHDYGEDVTREIVLKGTVTLLR
jgi:gliding motility-associated-like protein